MAGHSKSARRLATEEYEIGVLEGHERNAPGAMYDEFSSTVGGEKPKVCIAVFLGSARHSRFTLTNCLLFVVSNNLVTQLAFCVF